MYVPGPCYTVRYLTRWSVVRGVEVPLHAPPPCSSVRSVFEMCELWRSYLPACSVQRGVCGVSLSVTLSTVGFSTTYSHVHSTCTCVHPRTPDRLRLRRPERLARSFDRRHCQWFYFFFATANRSRLSVSSGGTSRPTAPKYASLTSSKHVSEVTSKPHEESVVAS